jgi:2-iminobutanoate/2-iminopropanoate deaminase
MSHHRETVTAEGAPKAAGPYSHAVKSGGLVFLSGQTPIDPATGSLVEGSIGDRTRRCLDNLAIVAAAAGASLEDAVRMGIYVTDISTFKDVNEAYGTYFPADPPARSTIGVASLPLGADVEIDAILALPD